MSAEPIPSTRTAASSDGPPADATRTVPPAPAVVFAGRYRVVRPLGEGGMGSVYLALDTQLDREVAIKVLPDRAATDDSVKRFRREAMALARLTHPGIVQAHDVGEHDGRPFLVMEYVAGENLSDRLRAGPMSPARAVDVGHQVAGALAYAHAQGLVHRDVKPSNLILAPDGRVKLLDLGLARFVQDHLADPAKTREGAGMGTPDYSAPEQFRDARLADARSDVYALGCTLYHLIGGRVPFPGSSLPEKLDAHEKQEPTPLAELAPEAPLGLALAVRKMMAKKPRDRFQSAREAADALAPFVAGGASTVHVYARTAAWDGSRLGAPVRRWPVATAVVGLLAGVVLAVLVGGLALRVGWLKLAGDGPELAERPEPVASPQPAPAPGLEEAPPPRVALNEPADPNVLTVSQKPEGGGTFRTINDALRAVKPGQTIRVLDAATYPEAIAFLPDRHGGVTVEAVRRATLSTTESRFVVLIRSVPFVTVRGFRLTAEAEGQIVAAATGLCSGVVLEDLEVLPGRAKPLIGIGTEQVDAADDDPPVVIRGCRVRQARVGIQVGGVDTDYKTRRTSRRVVVRDNRIEASAGAINLIGDLRQVQVVGNVVVGAMAGGIQLENLFETTRDILVANNTVADSEDPIRLWDDKAKGVLGTNVRFQNNLIVGFAGPEVMYKDADNPLRVRGPGDGAAVAAKWRFDHNWRESSADLKTEGLVPPGKTDVRQPKIDGLDRDPKSPTYLRPAKDTPLATNGAGVEDPLLPRYVGAMPPTGADTWDWDRAFRMPADAQLLTVSKDAKDGGKYRTITDALKDTKPWATVRVLDAATYPESVEWTDPARHTGVTLEAVAGATLTGATGARELISIQNVPFTVVRGFKVFSTGRVAGSRLVLVTGRAEGVTLDRLDLRAAIHVRAVNVVNSSSPTGLPPLTVRNCRFTVPGDAINVIGSRSADGAPSSTEGVAVVGNVVSAGAVRGITVSGRVRRVLIAGNVVRSSQHVNIQVDSPAPDASDIGFVNNTSFDGEFPFRYWLGQPPSEGTRLSVRLIGNLIFAADMADVGCVIGSAAPAPGEVARIAPRLGEIRNNWRDYSGQTDSLIVPAARSDGKFSPAMMTFANATTRESPQPVAKSPLATGGAGGFDPAYPPYAGAVPPEGIEPWDWDRTWRWTMAGPPPTAKK